MEFFFISPSAEAVSVRSQFGHHFLQFRAAHIALSQFERQRFLAARNCQETGWWAVVCRQVVRGRTALSIRRKWRWRLEWTHVRTLGFHVVNV